MEKNDLENKMYDKKFLDSMNYVQKTASEFKDSRTADMSNIYDTMKSIILNKDSLEDSLDYFLEKEDFNGNRFYAIGLLLDYAKHRLPEIDLIDYTLRATKVCFGESKNKGPLRGRKNSILPPSDI